MRAASSKISTPQHFAALDLIRGVAAIAVLVYHIDFMFGMRGALLTGGYTAVDLFFILSGFVIARTYEADVVSGKIDFRELAKRRIARLYPLYLATMFVGLFVMTARFRANSGFFDGQPLLFSAIANLFFLPTITPVYGSNTLFPFNAASWSIFYELVANIIFFAFFARARALILACLWVASGLGMVVVVIQFHGVDVGWGAPNALAAFPRVCFSFLSGMLIWRAYQKRHWSNPFWPVLSLIIMHLTMMQAREWLPVSARGWSDFVIITVLLPAIVAFGVGAQMRGASLRIGRFLGDISYAVYLTQDALIIAAAGATQLLLKAKIYEFAPQAGMIFLPLCIFESYLVFKYFEAPMRRLIRSIGEARLVRAKAGL